MTWLAAVDESGNLGSDSRFFVMSAVIVRRVRTLSSAFKAIPAARDESKFYNSTDEEILEVLKELSLTDVAIVSVEVDKYDYASKYYGVSGNALYRIVLTDLLVRVFGQVGSHDVNLFVDRSTFVSLEDLRSMATETSKRHGSNLKRCEKATSHQNKCVQIADFVAGSFYADLQHGDGRFREQIEEKILPCP